ncbi:hypothetical protein [Desulfoluna butyratoxydans]
MIIRVVQELMGHSDVKTTKMPPMSWTRGVAALLLRWVL